MCDKTVHRCFLVFGSTPDQHKTQEICDIVVSLYPLLTLIWVRWGRGNFTPPCWFSLNNSETVKAVTLVFSSIQ